MPETPFSIKSSTSAMDTKPRGANRSTKLAGKLKVLPEQPENLSVLDAGRDAGAAKKGYTDSAGNTGDSDDGEIDENEESQEEDVEVYNQISLIPAGTARRDALRLTKKKAKSLPRVTAYATASSYRMSDLMKFFVARKNAYHTNPKMIDEVIYTPYVYDPPPSTHDYSKAGINPHAPTGDLLGIPELREGHEAEDRPTNPRKSKFDTTSPEAEIFLFPYGTVVIWGMTEAQEKRFLSSIRRFETGKLGPDEIEMEDLNYYYANYSRIYNDVITLRKGSSYMTKLSLSHALSQSVKISLFEELISSTIEETKDIPEIISETGKIGMPHKEIMQQIGQLFLLRTNINSVGSVLDSPEVFWSFPDLQPLYDAARSYLEIPQRINLLNTRVEVLQDMLQLLKESVSSRHAERLEQIVIVLIGIEILLGVITILVDLMA
ncbi:cytoplasmic protein [Coprinopsis marcescibilis]|uniref:Cytoplasmic protein n=1 Tax=Coprinopsis marcescibilis TaxID=230819 RepID=A0A5C3KJX4_COPMA|nr:cytoplasmic protein [Coprinopsis marcescibilis]